MLIYDSFHFDFCLYIQQNNDLKSCICMFVGLLYSSASVPHQAEFVFVSVLSLSLHEDGNTRAHVRMCL